MPLDSTEPIAPLQSATIRAIIRGAIATSLAIILRATGKAVDDSFVKDISENGTDLLFLLYALWCYWKAYKGRVNATETIKKG